MIHVKGKADVTVDVKVTRHGPIITELIPGETRPLALRWTLYDGLRIPLFDVNVAQNWEDFRHAFSQFDAPGQNVVYADVDGNIGYQATGKFRFAQPGMAVFRLAAPTMRTSGRVTFRSRSCPAFTIRRQELLRLRMEESRRTTTSIRSAWNGRRRGGRRAFITCWSRDGNFLRPTCWRWKRTFNQSRICSRLSGLCMPWIMRPSLRRAPSRRQTLCATGTGAWWHRRRHRPSPRFRSSELRRLLLEPKVGARPPICETGRSFELEDLPWEMRSVWLENVLLHHPQRWLPEHPNYDELLTAAVEAAVNGPSAEGFGFVAVGRL